MIGGSGFDDWKRSQRFDPAVRRHRRLFALFAPCGLEVSAGLAFARLLALAPLGPLENVVFHVRLWIELLGRLGRLYRCRRGQRLVDDLQPLVDAGALFGGGGELAFGLVQLGLQTLVLVKRDPLLWAAAGVDDVLPGSVLDGLDVLVDLFRRCGRDGFGSCRRRFGRHFGRFGWRQLVR
jgi:hypothetical protein